MVKQLYDIPSDVMTDIVRIILQSGLGYKLMDAGHEIIRMELTIPDNSIKAKQKIEEIIRDYNFFRYQENEQES